VSVINSMDLPIRSKLEQVRRKEVENTTAFNLSKLCKSYTISLIGRGAMNLPLSNDQALLPISSVMRGREDTCILISPKKVQTKMNICRTKLSSRNLSATKPLADGCRSAKITAGEMGDPFPKSRTEPNFP
jgi:hypothetical protein